MRTIPSDRHQAEAMLELIKWLGWEFVSIVYEESSYGQMVCYVLCFSKNHRDRTPACTDSYFRVVLQAFQMLQTESKTSTIPQSWT